MSTASMQRLELRRSRSVSSHELGIDTSQHGPLTYAPSGVADHHAADVILVTHACGFRIQRQVTTYSPISLLVFSTTL